jgi:hypothetical protein
MLAPQQAWMSGLDHGEAVAFRALGFVANDQLELKRFLARSGLSSADLSQRPLPRGHLAAILDFLIDNESALLKFACRRSSARGRLRGTPPVPPSPSQGAGPCVNPISA